MSDDKKRCGITVAGSLIADQFFKIDTYPEEGKLVIVRETEGYVGGSGNIILDLARLDPELPVEVSAIVGYDDGGEMVMNTLAKYPNIKTDQIVREGHSAVTYVYNAQDTKQRTFFFLAEAADKYCMDHIDWDKLGSRIFHLEYLLLLKKADAEDPEYGTHGARILYEAKKRGMETSIDIVSEQGDRAKRVVSAALKYTDYCAINELEAEAVTEVDLTSTPEAFAANAKEALQKLKELGVGKWAVIHCPAMSFGLDCETGVFEEVPSFKLPAGYIKGTNGAGDAYCSGILYEAHRGGSLKDAMYLATACAARSLAEENGTDAMCTVNEVLEAVKAFEM